jgi:predicted nucleic acid-binding protein
VIGGRVLDPTAVLALISGQSEYMQALTFVSTDLGFTLAVPATALQAAWAGAQPHEQAWLDVLPQGPTVVVLDLDQDAAKAAGLLAAQAGTPTAHPAAAHAALIGLQRQWPVVTTSPDVLLALSADVRTETIP